MSKRKIMHVLYLHLAWPNYGLDVLHITMHTSVVIHLMNAYVWCWSKSEAHLMKFHLLQWEVVKVKFLMNSNDFNSALSASKDRPKGATRFSQLRSLRQGQRSN